MAVINCMRVGMGLARVRDEIARIAVKEAAPRPVLAMTEWVVVKRCVASPLAA